MVKTKAEINIEDKNDQKEPTKLKVSFGKTNSAKCDQCDGQKRGQSTREGKGINIRKEKRDIPTDKNKL